MKRVAYDELGAQFTRVLEKHGFTPADAKAAAVIFAQTSLSGVYSRGLNRFPRVVSYLEKGEIDPLARAECISHMGSMERWDGHRGFGPLHAQRAMDARRHLRLAGRRKRLHRHLLVDHRPQYACLGRQRLPHRQ